MLSINDYYAITFDMVKNHTALLLKLQDLNEETIFRIWKKDNLDLPDLNLITYDANCPLYQKMIFRFRDCKMNPLQLYKQLDPSNRARLILYCGSYLTNEIMIVLEFLAWITNSISRHQLYEIMNLNLDQDQDLDNDKSYQDDNNCTMNLLEYSRTKTIKFYFELDETIQKRCLDEYIKYFTQYLM